MAENESENLVGRYANYFKVGQNAYEFVLDFGQFYPENGKVQFHTRMITSPFYAKELIHTLCAALEAHENSFGDIDEK